VVVGASLAGLRTAEALRQAGFDGALTIVGAETHAPYNRPPLTKAALVDGPDAATLALSRSDDLDAIWILGVAATGLDLAAREVRLDNGESLGFDGLVIATGAHARRLPGEVGATRVHHVRTIDDSIALHRALAEPDRSVLVIGAGFLGSEVAATAATLGHRVTLVEAAAGPMLGALGPEVSGYTAALHRAREVDLRTSTTVLSLSPADGVPGRAVAVMADRSRGTRSQVTANVVVAALGATPNTEWLRASPLVVEGGVATDDSLTVLDATGSPVEGVVAVGDVAKVPQPLLDDAAARVEHWATAVGHSRIAAATLLGRQPQSSALPSFWTDQHGVQIRGVGLPGAADTTTVVDGSLQDHRFVVTRTRRGRLVGAIAVNNNPALFRLRAELESASQRTRSARNHHPDPHTEDRI
jgi:NADPH-dependent 2,4-dienoyl-CoA reductase/sulfur reductase-like enzyme